MDFSTLPSLIPQLWNFLLPPVLDTLIVLAIVWFILPHEKTKLLGMIHKWLLNFSEIRKLDRESREMAGIFKSSRFFNLPTKIFIAVFLLYAVQVLVSGIGSSLPGFVNLDKGKFIAYFLGPSAKAAGGAQGREEKEDGYELITECLAVYSSVD